MSVFCIPDDEGRIIQTNKVYDPSVNYERQIRDLGQQFVKAEQNSLVSMDHFYITNVNEPWWRERKITERPLMAIVLSKTAIKAGGSDTVVLTGAPRNCNYALDVNIPGIGINNVQSGVLPDGELEIGMDVPCLFTIRITLWPFQDFVQEIEAVG